MKLSKTPKVKLNNPLMGTETVSLMRSKNNSLASSGVKLNNPLMGTETLTLFPSASRILTVGRLN